MRALTGQGQLRSACNNQVRGRGRVAQAQTSTMCICHTPPLVQSHAPPPPQIMQVFHSAHPRIPTLRADVRLFQVCHAP